MDGVTAVEARNTVQEFDDFNPMAEAANAAASLSVVATLSAPSAADVSDFIGSGRVEQLQADGGLVAHQVQLRMLTFQSGGATPTPASERIKELVSYRWNDWSVSDNDQRQVVETLRNDPSINETVRDLANSNYLNAMLKRVDNPAYRRELIQTLGSRVDNPTADILRPAIADLDTYVVSGLGGAVATGVNRDLWQVSFNLARLGVTPSGGSFNRSAYNDLISPNPSAPFSGVGATGRNPIDQSVPLGDQWSLFRDDPATVARYSNPIPGSLSDYLNSVGPVDRRRQAELFLNQPVSTTMPEIYGAQPPTRADVIRAAAARYNLQPDTVAAFLLAEQRDQSQLEDAKDYTAATSLLQGNTSIGLGQVVISTARNNDLFSDLIGDGARRQLSHNDYARLLADDTLNIFATAKYIRTVADNAAAASPQIQSRFARYFPGVDFSRFRENSANWPHDNIQALGSEYTSAPWDNNPNRVPPYVDSPGWGFFVGEAYRDVRASGVF